MINEFTLPKKGRPAKALLRKEFESPGENMPGTISQSVAGRLSSSSVKPPRRVFEPFNVYHFTLNIPTPSLPLPSEGSADLKQQPAHFPP
jgi:hypothetical protein